MENSIFFHTCESMFEVKDGSVPLVIMSPPFTYDLLGKKLDKVQYLQSTHSILSEILRILAQNGNLVTINTDLRDHAQYNANCKDYEGTVWFKHSDLRNEIESIGFKCIDYKIWVKSLNINVYRYNFAHIMFFCKKGARPFRPGYKKSNSEFKSDVWFLKGGTQRVDSSGFRFRNAVHPEIVERCIEELTLPGDLVVSPFTGSGTILAVAELMGRKWIGYEIDLGLQLLIKESIYGPKRPEIYNTILSRYTKNENKSFAET
jgi:DNA modification methylase